MKTKKTVYPEKPFLNEKEFQEQICKHFKTPMERLINTIQMVAAHLIEESMDVSAQTLTDAVAFYREEMKQLTLSGSQARPTLG